MTYNSVVAADSPVAWWRLDEASGTTLVDSSGGGHPVTLGGSGYSLANASAPAGMPQTTLGVAAASTANSTYTPPQFAAITAEIWFNQNGQTNTGDSRLLADDVTSGSSFQLVGHMSGANFLPSVIFSVAGTWVFPQSAVAAPSSGWVHLAATFDSTTVHLYQNGAEVAGTGTALTGPLPAPANPVCLGGNDPWINAPFLGLLAQAAVYNTALSAAAILAHYNEGITAAAGGTPWVLPQRRRARRRDRRRQQLMQAPGVPPAEGWGLPL